MHNLLKCLVVVAGLMGVFNGASLQAKPKPSLEPFAGSYTGRAISRTAAGVLTGSATLTFTGRRDRMRGTFLYTGFLNSGGISRNVVQILNVSNLGVVKGRVTVDGVDSYGRGKISLRGKKLTTAITYTLGGGLGTVITINGKLIFRGKRAKWTAQVSSNDPAYNGTLVVTGNR